MEKKYLGLETKDLKAVKFLARGLHFPQGRYIVDRNGNFVYAKQQPVKYSSLVKRSRNA